VPRPRLSRGLGCGGGTGTCVPCTGFPQTRRTVEHRETAMRTAAWVATPRRTASTGPAGCFTGGCPSLVLPVATCHTEPAPPRRCSRRPGRREGQSPSVGPAPSTPAACRVLRRHRTRVGRGGAPEEAMRLPIISLAADLWLGSGVLSASRDDDRACCCDRGADDQGARRDESDRDRVVGTAF
jgi:hypothetical protein